MAYLFNTILYQPILNLLVLLYNFLPGHDIGLAIIILTILIRLLLYPLTIQSVKSQKIMRELQPKLDELKKKYKNDKEKLAKATLELYRREKISPFSSCLPLLIQLPFLFAVFRVFRYGLVSKSLENLYPFIHNPGSLNPISLGIFNLSKPVPLFALIAGLAQYWQSKMLYHQMPPKEVAKEKEARDESMAAMMNKQMLYMMPLFTVFIGLTLPGGLTLYWLVTTFFTIAQQYYFFRKDKKKNNESSSK